MCFEKFGYKLPPDANTLPTPPQGQMSSPAGVAPGREHARPDRDPVNRAAVPEEAPQLRAAPRVPEPRGPVVAARHLAPACK